MPDLQWSNNPPDKDGWYWFLWPQMVLPECVEVRIGIDLKPYVFRFDKWSSVVDTPFVCDAQWAGPIEIPRRNPWPWPNSSPIRREHYLDNLVREKEQIEAILGHGEIEDSDRAMFIHRLEKIRDERSTGETFNEQN